MIGQTKSSEPDVPEPIDPQCARLLDRIRIDCANRFPPLGDRALTQFKAKMRAYQANEIQSRIKALRSRQIATITTHEEQPAAFKP